MKKLIRLFKQISVLFLAITFLGCDDDETVQAPAVVAGFTYTLNIDTGTVTFINISENAKTYEWNFGDQSTSTEINPVKTYENGTYIVTLTSKNNADGSDVFEDEITILVPEIATLPISFDGENTKYDAETFGGASFAVVDNPDPSGSNATVTKVGAVTNIGAAFEGFYFDLGADVDLTTDKSISMHFWSDAPVNVLVKLEEGTGGPVETIASHGGTGWEQIYFTFDSDASYSRFTMFVDGPGTTAGTFYLDDITQINSADVPCPQTALELPIDFDCNGIAYTDKIVGNVSFEVVDNPELSGINSDLSKVGKITNVGENWENAFFNLDSPVDFSAEKGILLKIFSNQALPVKLKFEDGTEAPVEADVNHGGTGWEELLFNFTSSASYNDMIIFVDGPGTAAGTFYVDDIEQVVGEGCELDAAQSFAASSFNITFETDPGTTETIGDTDKLFLGDAGYEYADNPDFDNTVNSSCKVAKIDKAGGFDYANVQIFTADKFNLTDNTGFKLKIFSPNVGTNVLFKLEDTNNGAVFNQVSQLTSIANGWEELTFDFPESDTNKFDRIIIFFGFEQGDALSVHFDELSIYPRSGGGGGPFDDGLLTNGDFENGTEAWSGNALNVLTEGGNSFNFANVETAGNAFDVNLSQVIEIIQGKNYTLSFDASSDGNRTMIAGIGLNEGDFAAATETVNLTTAVQNFTLNLSAADFGSANSRVLFDMGADTGVVVIDNVSLFCDDCDGGGGNPPGTGDNLAANGDFETGDDTGWLLFQNGGTATLDDTVNNGGSWSGKLATGGASNPAFKQERIGAGTVAAGDVVQIQFDHIGAVDGEGGVFNVLLFGEGAGGAVPFTHVFSPAPTLAGSWTTFTGTFTIPAVDVSEGISFLIETVCGGAPGCSVSANIDNVTVTLNP